MHRGKALASPAHTPTVAGARASSGTLAVTTGGALKLGAARPRWARPSRCRSECGYRERADELRRRAHAPERVKDPEAESEAVYISCAWALPGAPAWTPALRPGLQHDPASTQDELNDAAHHGCT